MSEYAAALAEFDWLAARMPKDPLAKLKRGLALSALGEFSEARRALADARAVDSGFVEDFCRQLAPGAESPADLDPKNIYLWRSYVAQQECDWRNLERYLGEFRDAIRSPEVVLDRALCFASLHLPLEPSGQYALACKVASEVSRRVTPLPARLAGAPRKLRIGLLSAGFREHVDALLLLPLLELIDRKRFEIYAYSLAADDGSAVRDRMRRAATVFRDVSALRSESAARQMRRDEIDILLDTGGHAEGTRFEIVAARPAPLQVLYLGYAGTTGSDRVDYTILDPIVAPQGHEEHWSERIVYMPDTYFLYDFREAFPAVNVSRAEYDLPEDRPVICAFHKGEKIDPETFALWCRVLREAPSAVLWLLGERPTLIANLRRAAETNGVDPARLFFCGRENRDRYLARLRLADLFLDAVQHNAIVTTCDCLNAGLPVVTLHGRTCTTLSAESILRAAGLDELVSFSSDEYAGKALRLLGDNRELAALRARMAAGRSSQPLYDTAGRVRQLEHAFTEMWRRCESGLPPESFSVPKTGSMDGGAVL